MLIVAVLFLGGIVAAEHLGPPTHLGLIIWLALTGICALAGLGWPRGRLPLLAFGLFAAGAASLTLQKATLAPFDLRCLAPAEPSLASIRGHLRETPVHRLYSHQDHVTHRTQAEVDLTQVRWKNGDWQPAVGRVAVSTAGTLGDGFYGGREVMVEGVLRQPPGPTAPGGFDYRRYLARRQIYFQLQGCDPGDWRAVDESETGPAGRPWADRFAAWAMATMARGLPEEDEALQLLWAMTLGWKTALTGEVAEPFMRSGTMHVFAISGLHVALIAGLLITFLRVCQLPRRWCALFIIPLLWLYTGATGWQASAIRSTVMMSVIVAGWLFARPSDLLNSLAAAAFIILVWDPAQLFQAGFQLSFAVVLSLALLGPILDAIRRRMFQYDPWVPDDLRPRWQHWLRRPIDYVTSSTAVSLVAWLGSLPLIAAYFNLCTPISLVANLVVVPLSSGALACSFGSLVAGPFVPIAGELFNHSAWFLMTLMIRASEWAAAVPLGCFHVPGPNWPGFLAYYAALGGIFAGIFRRPRLRGWFAAGLAALVATSAALAMTARHEFRLTIIPMNGGGVVHLASPRAGEDWLIDCGDDASAGFVLKPYLRGEGLNRIENLLFTHGDVHHAGGAAVLRSSFTIERAWFSPVPFRSPIYRQARAVMDAAPSVAHTLHRGQSVPPWQVLHPDDTDRQPQADDNAVVLLGQFGATRVLLLSDLGKPGQNLLLSRYPDLKADLVIAGIPARTEPVADALLESIQPRLLVIADAEYPATQRASAALRERLAAKGTPVLYTRETGALVFTFTDRGWNLRSATPTATSALH